MTTTVELATHEWMPDAADAGAAPTAVLVHGVTGWHRTWWRVGPALAARGWRAVAVDQRGHGLSDKPDTGYGFDEVTADLKALIEALGLERPVLAGQSYGGQVALDFAARWPALLSGLVLVDGGFIELSTAPGATWEQTAVDLKPPPLTGMPRQELLQLMRDYYPTWPESAIEMQMGNFETLPDGTVRPWLTLDRHVQILRVIWEQRPSELYARVKTPALIAAADDHGRDGNLERKRVEVAAASAGIEIVRIRWFQDTAHDIHVERPVELADWILDALSDGFFAAGEASRA